MLAGLGGLLAFDAALLDDLKTAVSEACNNVVLHAYDGEPGPLVLDLKITGERIEVVVRDEGSGIRQLASSDDRMGVGLAVISALADSAEFVSTSEGGTEVRMSFTGARAATKVLDRQADRTGEDPVLRLSGDVVATLSPVPLLTAVLGRVARALAVGAHFSLDRFSDLDLVTDLVAAYAQTAACSARIGFAIVAADRRLELTVGPFQASSCAQLEADASLQRPVLPLVRLADEITVQRGDHAEMLRVVLIDQRCGGTDTPG